MDINLTYNGLDIESSKDIEFNILNPEVEDFDIYNVYIDSKGNNKCKKVNYRLSNDEELTFSVNSCNKLVFIKKQPSKILFYIFGILCLIAIICIILVIIIEHKNKNKKRKKRGWNYMNEYEEKEIYENENNNNKALK